MSEYFKKRISNLLSVKSIVTLALTVVFSVLALRGIITGKDFMTVFTVIIAFYFGSQSQKSKDVIEKRNDEQAGE